MTDSEEKAAAAPKAPVETAEQKELRAASQKAAKQRDLGTSLVRDLRLAADLVDQAAAGRMSKKDFQSDVGKLISKASSNASSFGSGLPDDPKADPLDVYARTTADKSAA